MIIHFYLTDKGNECGIIELELERCAFESDGLPEKWLSELNAKVSKLDIINSTLRNILVEAFNSDVFKTTLLSLTIDNKLNVADNPFTFQLFAKDAFKGLTKLSTLIILNNPTLEITDPSAFQNIAGNLIQLKITRIANPWSLSRISSSTKFKKISTVDLQYNNFSSLNGSMFTSFAEYVKSLILTNSKIESIAANTFSNFKQLEALFLESNLLQTLEPGLFDAILTLPDIQITLRSNYWHCDCDLSSMQTMIADFPDAFPGELKCNTPLTMRNFEIVSAELSNESCETTNDAGKFSENKKKVPKVSKWLSYVLHLL